MGGNKKSRSGFLFMLIIVALLGIVIYAYKDKFMVLFNTSFSSGKDFFSKNFSKNNNENNLFTEKINLLEKEDQDKIKKNVMNNFENIKEEIGKVIKKSDSKNDKEINEKNDEEIKKDIVVVQEKKIEKNIKSRKSQLYFSVIENDDSLKLISVPRNINYTNMPLTETLKALLTGPSSVEQNSKIITNIPNNTKLLSVSIKNNIAYVNFSKEFEFNSYGRDATVNQIKQVVYTVTEFANVHYVQFMINGQVKTYLGGEGVLISKPFSRHDFS